MEGEGGKKKKEQEKNHLACRPASPVWFFLGLSCHDLLTDELC